MQQHIPFIEIQELSMKRKISTFYLSHCEAEIHSLINFSDHKKRCSDMVEYNSGKYLSPSGGSAISPIFFSFQNWDCNDILESF